MLSVVTKFGFGVVDAAVVVTNDLKSLFFFRSENLCFALAILPFPVFSKGRAVACAPVTVSAIRRPRDQIIYGYRVRSYHMTSSCRPVRSS